MKEIEKLLDKLIRFTKNNPYDDKSMELGGSYKAEILRRFGELEKGTLQNPCEKHLNVKANDYCPICLLQRAEAAEAELKEKELTSICVYCGTKLISKSIDTKMNDIIEHMAECKKHPVPSMLDKLLEIKQWFLQHREHSLEIWNGYATLHNNGMFTLSQSDDKTAGESHD